MRFKIFLPLIGVAILITLVWVILAYKNATSLPEWKTYKNTTYDYQFNYPGNWTVKRYGDDGDVRLVDNHSDELVRFEKERGAMGCKDNFGYTAVEAKIGNTTYKLLDQCGRKVYHFSADTKNGLGIFIVFNYFVGLPDEQNMRKVLMSLENLKISPDAFVMPLQ